MGSMIAEAFLGAAAHEILKKVVSVAREEISLAWGFKGELTKLKESVIMVQAVLRDAERQVTNEAVKLWLKKLKDVAHDADDVLDEFTYEILKRKVEIRNQMTRKVATLRLSARPASTPHCHKEHKA
uniref:Putative disease resistance protein RGA4 n=1 Tax=Davidia involucrata TaxID=16924 RepID=A0A5B7BRS8_DAVIN